ncbi:DNA-binding transcriptional MocR family regulator [Paraburkholderia sp. WC7.3d]
MRASGPAGDDRLATRLRSAAARDGRAGDVALVEQPAYPATLQALKLQQADVVTVPVDQHGLDVAQLAALLEVGTLRPALKLLYTCRRSSRRVCASAGCSRTQIAFRRPAGGMFVWARLDAVRDASDYLRVCIEQNVMFVPGVAFYQDAVDRAALCLSFAAPGVEEIETGLRRMKRALEQYVERK